MDSQARIWGDDNPPGSGLNIISCELGHFSLVSGSKSAHLQNGVRITIPHRDVKASELIHVKMGIYKWVIIIRQALIY